MQSASRKVEWGLATPPSRKGLRWNRASEEHFPPFVPEAVRRPIAASAVGAPRLLAADGAEAYGGLRMGIQRYSLRERSFEKMLEAMQNDLKLHYVELFPSHGGKSPPQIKEPVKNTT